VIVTFGWRGVRTSGLPACSILGPSGDLRSEARIFAMAWEYERVAVEWVERRRTFLTQSETQ
jgi:hypothetical protein